MAVSQRRPNRTWSLLGEVKRRPSPYEVTAAKFNYHFRRQPAPFEMDPQAALNVWYLQHREGSAFNVPDWEGFRDPARLTYSDYVMLQHDRETYLDLLIDHHEAAGSMEALDPAWVQTLRDLLVPLRFPLHVLQMTGAYVAQMAPSAFIINCANFQAADELRRIQRIAYTTRMLADAHDERLADTEPTRQVWEGDAAWQPLRELLELMLGAHDWGEAFAALNLAVKPVIDALVNWRLAELAADHGDEYLSLLLAEFRRDSRRSRDWTAALVRYALAQDPAVAGVLTPWCEVWQPRAERAVQGVATLFEKAPRSVSADEVVATTQEQLRVLLDAAGL